MRRRALVEPFVFAAVLGAPDGALGVLWPSLRDRFDRPLGDLGLLVLVNTVPYLAASVGAGALARRFGYAGPVRVATAGAAVALAAWAVAPAWVAVLATVAALGGCQGALDGAVNVDAGVARDARRLGVVHATYGVGAALGPVIAGPLVALSAGGWRVALAVLAAAAAVAAVGTMTVPGTGRRPPPPAAVARTVPARGVVVLLLGGFVLYTGVEVATGSWAFTLLTEDRGAGPGPAAALTAAYWAALTVSRVGLAVAGHRVPARTGIRVAVVLALAGSAVLWADPRGWGAAGLVLMGAAFGPVFPLAVGLVADVVGERRAPAVIGWAIAAATVGGPLVTTVAGQAAEAAGPGAIAATVAVGTAALAAVQFVITAMARPPSG